MLKRFAALLLLSGFALVANAADPYSGFRDTYVARTGDLNGDGKPDVYLDYRPKIIPIVYDDLTIPIPVRNTLADFVLLQNANGGFTKSSVTSSQRNQMKQWAKQAAIELIFGDFNADRLLDVLVKKIGSVIPGVRDVIVYGPDTAGSVPAVIRDIDGPFKMFIRDLTGWMENRQHYYDNAWYVTCVPTLQYVQVLRFTDNGVPYYSIELAVVNQCGWVFDSTNYSVPGIYFLSALYDPMEDRGLERGSTNADVISDILEGFLGIPFMRNFLEAQENQTVPSGDRPLAEDYCSGPIIQPEVRDYCRAHAMQEILVKIFMQIGVHVFNCFDSGFPASHHYEFGEPVCTVGSARCNVPEVYQNESLVHPVVGYWDKTEPIYDVANHHWNPPAPEGFAALNCTMDVPNACDTVGMYDAGRIHFEVDPSVFWHKNVTEAGHIFDPGSINRSVYSSGGTVTIYTIGEGTGHCPRTNETGGTAIFHTLNAFIACHLKGGCHVRHPVGQ